MSVLVGGVHSARRVSVNEHRKGRQRTPRGAPNRRTGSRSAGGGNSARHSYERYLALAREAARHGDKIEMENCYQYAEHFFRIMNNRD